MKPLYIIIREILLEKVSERWFIKKEIIKTALEICEYRVNKCEEHFQYAMDNKIEPLDAIKYNKRTKVKNYMNFSIRELISTAQKIKDPNYKED